MDQIIKVDRFSDVCIDAELVTLCNVVRILVVAVGAVLTIAFARRYWF